MWLDLWNSVRFVLNSVLMLVVLSMLGCGLSGTQPNYTELGLVEISGTIRLDGTPLENAHIEFKDEDGTFSYSDTDHQGRYRLRFDSKKYGTVPGKKIVRIQTGAMNSYEAMADSEDPDAKPVSVASSPFKIPACYNEQSILVKQVTEAESNVDFDLKSAGVTNGVP